jgi:hypothetical protein
MTNTNNKTRFKVLDANDRDRLCGVWYATTEVEAIRMAISEGYDAWCALGPSYCGW